MRGVRRLLGRIGTLATRGTRRMRRLHVGCLDGGNRVGTLVTSFHGIPNSRGGRINVGVGRLGGTTLRGVGNLGRRVRRTRSSDSSVSLAHATCPMTLKAHRPLAIIGGRVVSVFNHVKFALCRNPRMSSSGRMFAVLGFTTSRPTHSVRSAFFVRGASSSSIAGGMLLHDRASGSRTRCVRARRPPVHMLYPKQMCHGRTVDTHTRYFFRRMRNLCMSGGMDFASLGRILLAFTHRVFNTSAGVHLHPDCFPFARPDTRVSVSYGVYNNGKYGFYGRAK